MLSPFDWEMPVATHPLHKQITTDPVQKSTQIFERNERYANLLARLNPEQWLKSANTRAAAAGKHVERSKLVEEASPLVLKVQASHSELYSILKRHEPTIVRRWSSPKHKQAWRESKLRKALPGIPEVDRPDVAYYFNLNEAAQRSTKELDSLLKQTRLPFLNIKLAEITSTLPMFLKARGRNHPARFILQDVQALHIACHVGYLSLTDPSANDVWVIKDPEQAQKTDDWFNYQYAMPVFKDFMSTQVESPTFLTQDKYLMGLEQNHKILRFLIDICHEILSDHSMPLTDEKYPVQPEPQLPDDTGVLEPRMNNLMRNATYGTARLEFQELGRIVRRRYDQACSDLWAARESPSYFNHLVLAARDSYHVLRDTDGHEMKIVTPNVLKKPDWIEVMRLTLLNLLLPVLVWQSLDTHLREYIESITSWDRSLASGVQRARNVDAKFLALCHALRNIPFVLWRLLGISFHGSRYIRANYRVVRGGTGQVYAGAKDVKDPLMSTMLQLFSCTSDYGDKWFFDTGRYALEHLRAHCLVERQDKAKLTAATWALLDDCLLIEDIRSLLAVHEPWRTMSAPSGETDLGPLDKESLPDMMQAVDTQINDFVLKKWEPWLDSGVNFEDFASSRNPLYYPEWQKPSKDRTKRMQDAEKHLDNLWERFEAHLGMFSLADERGRQQDEYAVHILFGDAWVREKPARTPDWVEPTSTMSVDISARPLTAQGGPSAWYNQQSSADQQSSRWKLETSSRGKEKTRKEGSQTDSDIDAIIQGFAALPMAEENLNEPVGKARISAANPEGVVFPLSRKAMDGARQLWPQLFRKRSDGTGNGTGNADTYASQAGSMHWRQFLKIWTEIGFSIIPITGSSWEFCPTADDAKKVFREPFQQHKFHPDSKTPRHIVMKIGRHLKRKYDVEADWFGQKIDNEG